MFHRKLTIEAYLEFSMDCLLVWVAMIPVIPPQFKHPDIQKPEGLENPENWSKGLVSRHWDVE